MKKTILAILLYVLCIPVGYSQSTEVPDSLSHYTVINTVVEHQQVAGNDHQVISNLFKHNWFILADVGVNTYWSDYTAKSSLTARMSPQFNLGFGKWFVPGYGAKVQMTGFSSRADKWYKGNFTNGSKQYIDKDGNPYWKEYVKGLNFNVDLMFNLSRIINGYEGMGTSKMMNQLIASVGVGATFPFLEKGTANDFAGHVELQYSRFFSTKKNLSLDLRLRGLLQSTQFDGVCEQFIDDNYSLNVGLTYYFEKRGWERSVAKTSYYLEDKANINYLKDEIARLQHELALATAAAAAASMPDTLVVNNPDAVLITFPYLVNFVIDKVKVVNRERVNLRVVAEMMKATPNQKYLICGYADKHTGSVARNIWLAKHRSKNVYKILTEEFGVPASQLVLDDKGGVENMFYDDPQLSRSAIITRYEE